MKKIVFWFWRKKIFSLILLVFVAGGTYLYAQHKDDIEPGSENKKVTVVSRGDIRKTLSLTGNAKIVNEQKLRFNRSGRITGVYAAVGDTVKKGDLLVQLDNTEALTQIRRSEINYQKTVKDLAKLKNEDRNTDILEANSTQKETERQLSQAAKDLEIIQLNDAKNIQDYWGFFRSGVNDIQEGFDALQVLYEDPKDSEGYFKIGFGNRSLSSRPLAQAKLDLDRMHFKTLKGAFHALDFSGKPTLAQMENFSEQFLDYLNEHWEAVQSIKTMATYTKADIDDEITEEDQKNVQMVAQNLLTEAETLRTQILSKREQLMKYETTENGLVSEMERKKIEDIEKLKLQLEVNARSLNDTIENNTEQIDAMQDNLSLQALELQKTKRELEQYQIQAPFDGVIRQIDYKVGDNLVTDESKYVVVEDPDQVEIKAQLDQQDVVQAEVGQKAIITFNALPNQEFIGEIKQIDSTPAEGGGEVATYPIKITLKREKQKIYSGMSARIEIVIGEKKEVLYLPNMAMSPLGEGKATVQKKVGETFEALEVETGLVGDMNTEILSGVEEGTEVLELDLTDLDDRISPNFGG